MAGSRRRKTAPGKLQVVLDFLRTGEGRRDPLTGPDVLHDWLVEKALLSDGTPLDDGDHQDALAVRRGLHVLALVNSGERDPEKGYDPAALDALRVPLEYRARFTADGTGRRLPTADGWPLARTCLVDLVLDAMAAGTWNRVKVCPGCGTYFYDVSNNLSGKWCPSKRCSSRSSSRTFRRRHPRPSTRRA